MTTRTAKIPSTVMIMPLVLAACSSSTTPGNHAAAVNATPAAANAAPATSPTAAPSPTAKAVARAEKNDLLDYGYSYPAEAASIAALKAVLDQRGDQAKAKALADARADQKAATTDDFPFHAHYYHADWTVAADTPRFLSLVGTIATFTGGAHGMTVFDPLLWDKQNAKPVEVADLFASHQALETALRSRFCQALDRERAKRRGAPVTHDDDPFDACIDPVQETIVPAASGNRTIDSLTVYVAPYDAGPYAEGDYRISVAMDAALLEAIKPEYRGAFSPSPS